MGKIYKNGIEYGGGGGSAAGGHTILDNDGNTMPTEDNLQFKGLDVTDNSTDGVTEVESAGLNQDSMDDVLSASASGVQVASDGMSYSTDEQVVGKWIDGKPLYQRTVEFSTGQSIGASAWWTSNIPATDIETPVEAMAHCRANADASLWYSYSTPLGVSNSSGPSHMSNLEFFNLRDNSVIIVYAITIKYTKTTD